MRKSWWRATGLAMAGTLVAALAGVGAASGVAGAASSTPAKGGAVTLAVGSEARSLDPASSTTQNSAEGAQLGAVYDRLLMIVHNKVTPRLALSATPSKDLMTWTIKLRPNLKFSDGTPFDAAAVKANWDRHQNTATSLCRPALAQFQRWTATDATTLTVNLKVPVGDPFYGALQGCLGVIASPAALQSAGTRYGTSPETTVGAGPFTLKEWVRNDHMTLSRNASYWDKPKPYLDSVTFKTVADTAQRASSLITGQTQLAFFAVVDPAINTLQQANLPCQAVPQYGGTGFAMNLTRAPFDDVRIRRAFAYATDMKDLSQKATAGLATPVDTFFPKGSPFYDPTLKQKTNNLAEAQKLVDSYVAEKGPVKPINFVMAAGFRSFGLVLDQQWARLKGVTVTVNEVPSAAAVTALNSGNFDIAASGTQGVDPDDGGANSLYAKMHTGETANAARYSNPEVDGLLDHARAANNDAVRKSDYTKVIKTLFDQVPYVMAYRAYQPTCTAKSVKGLSLFDVGNVDFSGISISSK